MGNDNDHKEPEELRVRPRTLSYISVYAPQIALATSDILFGAQFFHSFYLKYLNPETKEFFKGSIVGMQFEWFLHNVVYYISGYEGAKDVNLGESIFRDEGHGFPGLCMKIAYLAIHPILGIIDLVLGGGWGNDFKKAKEQQ